MSYGNNGPQRTYVQSQGEIGRKEYILSQLGIVEIVYTKRDGKRDGHMSLSALCKDELFQASSSLEKLIGREKGLIRNLGRTREILTASSATSAEMRALDTCIIAHEALLETCYDIRGKMSKRIGRLRWRR